jgi:hypothetical protein
MPRQSQTQPNTRKEIRQQDTFRYAEKRQVSARPVDAHVQNYQSKEAQGIMEAFNIGADSLVKVNTQLSADAKAKGELLGDINGELPENPRQAMLDGYNNHRGGADTLAYQGELAALGLDLPPEEYHQKRKEISDKYTIGKSDSYLQGFVPKALHFEQTNDLKYQQKQQENFQEGWKEDASSLFMSETIAHKGDPAKMRESMSNLQARGAAVGLDKTQSGKGAIRALVAYAENTGRPELLDFIGIPDAHGTKLIDTELGHELLQSRNRALRQSEHNIALQERNEAKAGDAVEMEIIKLLDAGDTAKARTMVNQYSSSNSPIKLSPEKAEHFYKAISADEVGGSGYAKQSDPKTYYDLKVAASNKEATFEDANTALNNRSLSYADFKEVTKEMTNPTTDKMSAKSKAFIANNSKAYVINPMEKYDTGINDKVALKGSMYQAMMAEEIETFKGGNGGTEPNLEALMKLHESVKAAIELQIPQKSFGASPSVPQATTKKDMNSRFDTLK